jgi:hypothetical protein
VLYFNTIQYLFHSITKYSLLALGVNDLSAIRGACPIGSTDAACSYYNGSQAFQQLYGLDGNQNKWISWVCQIAFLIGFILAGLFVYQFVVWTKPDTPESPRFVENEDHNVDMDSDQQQKSLDVLPDGAVVQWYSLKYTVPVKDENGNVSTRVLLDDVYGVAKPNMMVALMGSTGAGTYE